MVSIKGEKFTDSLLECAFVKLEAKETGLDRSSVAGLHVISVGTLGYWHLLLHTNGNVPI